ncbi:MAG: FAD:protein FMN transferase [Acetobacteraceae bacterium]|nr:FAD:protein FMN transferase [Acetobacteraceae bacterium]
MHPDRATAEAVTAEVLDEVARLEQVFSLLRPESEISRLNREGSLADPSHELVLLVQRSLHLARLTDGAFDITVQPLWQLYADHFARAPTDRDGPPQAAIDAALGRTGWRHVAVAAGRISFDQPGMAITLNGVAQGYITDRITGLLARRGLSRALVSLGEHRALGAGPYATTEAPGWHIGLRDPRHARHTIASIGLENRALATSGGYGTTFSADGRHHHLFNPATGRSAHSWASASVLAATAAEADGWSTALAVLPESLGLALLDAGRGAALEGAVLVRHDGRIVRIGHT